jgi:chromosome segregation ATPase
MATKAEERKALEQIRKIIEGLGPDSYIATAMDGMIEDAEENIQNDFAISMKDRCMTAEAKMTEVELECSRIAEERDMARKELALAKKTLSDESDRRSQLRKDFDQLRIEKFEAENRAGCAESKMVEMKEEIIHLKAKLYDLMTKEN